jgi:hypothetical protein
MNQKQSIELILQDQVAILSFRSPSPGSESSSGGHVALGYSLDGKEKALRRRGEEGLQLLK